MTKDEYLIAQTDTTLRIARELIVECLSLDSKKYPVFLLLLRKSLDKLEAACINLSDKYEIEKA